MGNDLRKKITGKFSKDSFPSDSIHPSTGHSMAFLSVALSRSLSSLSLALSLCGIQGRPVGDRVHSGSFEESCGVIPSRYSVLQAPDLLTPSFFQGPFIHPLDHSDLSFSREQLSKLPMSKVFYLRIQCLQDFKATGFNPGSKSFLLYSYKLVLQVEFYMSQINEPSFLISNKNTVFSNSI